MYLEKAKVVNFRGIRNLSINFEDTSTVLIGENHHMVDILPMKMLNQLLYDVGFTHYPSN